MNLNTIKLSTPLNSTPLNTNRLGGGGAYSPPGPVEGYLFDSSGFALADSEDNWLDTIVKEVVIDDQAKVWEIPENMTDTVDVKIHRFYLASNIGTKTSIVLPFDIYPEQFEEAFGCWPRYVERIENGTLYSYETTVKIPPGKPIIVTGAKEPDEDGYHTIKGVKGSSFVATIPDYTLTDTKTGEVYIFHPVFPMQEIKPNFIAYSGGELKIFRTVRNVDAMRWIVYQPGEPHE